MGSALMVSLSTGIAAAVLFVIALHALRAKLRDLPEHRGDSRWRSATGAHASDSAAGSPPSRRKGGPPEPDADRRPGQNKHGVPAARGDKGYDPRSLEDKARRRIAYLLIALLALQVTGLMAMVVFGIITVGDVKGFGVILGPLVTLVAAATSFYYATRRN